MFVFPFFFFYMGGGVLYMYFFFFATHHPHVITNTAWTHHHCIEKGWRRAVGYRKGAWIVLANSCRCGAGGKTIRLSSQRSRVRNPAPLCFFPVLCFLFCVFLFFFYMGGGVLCMYVLFYFFATHHPHVITTTAWTHHHCIEKGWRRAVGYRRGSVNGLGQNHAAVA